MSIPAQIETRSIPSPGKALDLYGKLRAVHGEDRLFLLESLAGPARDGSRSIIGFDPMLTLEVSDRTLSVQSLEAGPVDQELITLLGPAGKDRVHRSRVADMEAVFVVLRRLEALFDRQGDPDGTFGMGWFGYFGYDTIFMIEDLEERIDRSSEPPVISLTLYRGIVTLNPENGSGSLTIIHIAGDCPELAEQTMAVLAQSCPEEETVSLRDTTRPYRAHDSIDRDHFSQWFAKAKRHIAQGDVYQLQLGHEIVVDSAIAPFQVYCHLRSQDPSPYMYYFVTPQGLHIIGASPELFIGLTPQGQITLRPIAGTVGNPAEGGPARQAAIDRLTSDPKERSEHLMLVDLGRNDVARCCIPESLEVTQLMVTELYSHVIHMVSNVVGQLRPELDKYDAFAAAFPAGTMTGTPKVRAVELIEETEVTSRGVYAGAVGFLGFDGRTLTALCIRTAAYQAAAEGMGTYRLRASAGIVEDSQVESEWLETIKKMSSAYLAITGKELADEGFIG
ncbi:2-amino-4-deoxychorismate synthase [Bifidobacterium aemilianum]|uniref:2-amino-4-deoxychorismate synthase n=1 Tax=Bifidobacterium aemilianum TaxID=2493120 RepID=A0A366K950_9BIFI|nr:anthranilate synthase component I family protein [Bifidobacterium aemilianum]RBP97847.1 2-amino-4-deoxychorismate synthase [Bifidobacterium aemilianum]